MTSGRYLVLLFTAVWLCEYAAPIHAQVCCDQACSNSIYLVRHGWHTSLAVKRCEISTVDWPESLAVGNANFIEVGWGDEDYLCSGFLNPLVLVKAGCLPSRSAIHVAGFRKSPGVFFKESQIIEFKVSPCQMRKLCRFIRESYARDRKNCPIYLGSALYGCGGIYRASGHYYVPKTCNIWTAKALEAAGIPVVVPLCTFAQPLVCQSKKYGREVKKGTAVLPVMYPFVNFNRPNSR